MDKLQIRIKRVTKDDYDKVMDMFPPGEIYNGTDYLSDYFYMLIDMSNVEAYAAVLDDKFVSFVLFYFVDDGKTMITRASRTRKDYEGHGLFRRLLQHFETRSSQKQSLIYHAATGHIDEKEVLRKFKTGKRYKVLQKDFRTYLGTSTTELKTKLHINVKSSTLISNKPELSQLLCNRSTCDLFFPEGRIMVDWVPYRLMQSNTPLIDMERTTAVASNLHNHEHALLTFVSSYRAHIRLVWNLDIYGHVDSTIREHILLHYNNMTHTNVQEHIFIRCFCPDRTKWDLISAFMKYLGFDQRLEWGVGIICSERKLTESSNL